MAEDADLHITPEDLGNPEDTVHITVEDARRAWRGYWASHVVQGIDLTSDFSQEIKILPPDFNGRVYYDPNADKYASYMPSSDAIRVGRKSIRLGEGLLGAMLRHEDSHAVFASLNAADQQELVDSIWEHNGDAVRQFYPAIQPYYDADYFSEERARGREHYGKEYGREQKYTRIEMLWDGDTLRPVDITFLIDELIAYSLALKGGGEYLPEGEGWQKMFDLGASIISHLDDYSKGIIERHGFTNISAAALIEELKRDPNYPHGQ